MNYGFNNQKDKVEMYSKDEVDDLIGGSSQYEALALRVTALENGKQPNVLYGTSAPTSGQGNDGDVYIQY